MPNEQRIIIDITAAAFVRPRAQFERDRRIVDAVVAAVHAADPDASVTNASIGPVLKLQHQAEPGQFGAYCGICKLDLRSIDEWTSHQAWHKATRR